MRMLHLAAVAIAAALASAPTTGAAQDLGTIFEGLSRALTPDQERERTERRSRYEEYDRDSDRRRETPYSERYDPEEDRFWSEAARRLDRERMGNEERRRYERLSDSERRRYDEDAGDERQRWYEERASDSERRRYDEALEEMEDEISRDRRRGG